MQGGGYPGVIQFRIDDWELSFSPARGDTLHVGTYSGAIRHPFNFGTSSPGMDVDGQGRGYLDVTGTFTINSIVFDHWNRLRSADISFEQRCQGATGGPARPDDVRGRSVRRARMECTGTRVMSPHARIA